MRDVTLLPNSWLMEGKKKRKKRESTYARMQGNSLRCIRCRLCNGNNLCWQKKNEKKKKKNIIPTPIVQM